MIISKTKYEVEKLKYEQRIEYLENLICPCESHDYHEVDFRYQGGIGNGGERKVYYYRCSKCGKIKVE